MEDPTAASGAQAQGAGGVHSASWDNPRGGGRAGGGLKPEVKVTMGEDRPPRLAWEGPEEAESTWEPVSRVFDGATAVLRKELKALRLKMDQKRGLVQQYGRVFGHIVDWG